MSFVNEKFWWQIMLWSSVFLTSMNDSHEATYRNEELEIQIVSRVGGRGGLDWITER